MGDRNTMMDFLLYLYDANKQSFIFEWARYRKHADMMLSHRLLVASVILAPSSKCSVPGSFEDSKIRRIGYDTSRNLPTIEIPQKIRKSKEIF